MIDRSRPAKLEPKRRTVGARRATLRMHLGSKTPPQEFPLTGRTQRIGSHEAGILIEDLLVSPQHAAIDADDDGILTLRDLGSRTGTFLNGGLLIGPAELRHGDDIRIGPAHLQVRIEDE